MMSRGLLFSGCSLVGTFLDILMLARYLRYLLTAFDQTLTTNEWGKDGCIKFCGQKVKCLGHGSVKYALKCTFWPCSCQLVTTTI